ncbi:MAG: tetratricopeptide repeat protein [Desulfobacterales bacterium]|nr:tetratricopeptide repeat protein [Desulfobacterales bacterium]
MNEPEEQRQEIIEESEEKKQAQADFDQGKVFLETGELTMAAAAFHNALVGYDQLNDLNGVANAAVKLGDICLARKDYAAALRHFERADAICAKEQDLSSSLFLKKKFIKARVGLKQFREAVAGCMDLLDIYSGNNNPDGAVKILGTLKDIYLKMDEPGKAADALRTVASIHSSFGHKRTAESVRAQADALESGRK